MAIALGCLDQRRVLGTGPEALRIIRRSRQSRQLIQAPLGTLTPCSGGHLSAIRNDLDQGRTCRRTCGAQVNVADRRWLGSPVPRRS